MPELPPRPAEARSNIPLSSLQQTLESRLRECIAIAEQYFDTQFVYHGEIRHDIRGRCAGQLCYERPRRTPMSFSLQRQSMKNAYFRFNPEMLFRYQREFIEQVVPHEVAHLVAYSQYGMDIKPHGQEWKHVMANVFLCEPSVRHTFEHTVARQVKKYSYECKCEGLEHTLGAIRHKRMLTQQASYKCRRCHAALRPLITAERQA